MAIARPRLTLEEFLRLPEEKPALEFAEGVVTHKVSPTTKRSRLQLVIAQKLDAAGAANRAEMAFTELRVTFAGRSVVPDVSVFRWNRLPRAPDGGFENDVVAPPDVVVGREAIRARFLRRTEQRQAVALKEVEVWGDQVVCRLERSEAGFARSGATHNVRVLLVKGGKIRRLVVLVDADDVARLRAPSDR